MTDDRRESLLDDLTEHLRATEELPVSPSATHWLGEAHAVAEDLAAGDVDDDVLRERLGHVRHLLDSAGETGNEAADERVEAALRVLGELGRDAGDGAE